MGSRAWRPVVTRRRLQVSLAFLWLLDGALQLQPFMFTRGFGTQVVAPSAAGQPAPVAAVISWSASIISGHPVAADLVIAGVQLALGIGLLLPRMARVALVASAAWALGVWLFGEGLGGVLGGTGTLFNGAPGAALLYAVLALGAWPRLDPGARRLRPWRRGELRPTVDAFTTNARDDAPARWLPLAWAGTWLLFAALQALPANRTPAALGAQVGQGASSLPGPLAHLDHVLGAALAHQSAGPAMAVALEVVIGLLALHQGTARRVAAVCGTAVALAVWVLAQGLGQLASGTATDPNAALLVGLLGIGVLGTTARTQDRARTRAPAHTPFVIEERSLPPERRHGDLEVA